jgi:hypothetical protein
MKLTSQLCAPLLFGAFLLSACGDDTGGATGSGGSGGAASSSTTTAASTGTGDATTAATTAGTGGEGSGTGGAGTGGEGTGGAAEFAPACEPPEEAPSAGACVNVGATAITCNPVTNEGCDEAASEVCDVDIDNEGFTCFGPPNGLAVCDDCPGAGDAYCGPGLTCDPFYSFKCLRFCCEDTDCGEGGVCVKDDGLIVDAPFNRDDADLGLCYLG